MRIVMVSDTHVMHGQHKIPIPDGDILIHAGDLTICGNYMETAEAGKWLSKLPHKHKIVIAGNHDFLFESDQRRGREAIGDGFDGIRYVQDQLIEIEGIKIFGSPWTPRFYDWAFQLDNHEATTVRPDHVRTPWKDAAEHWQKIPVETQLLITHGPPYGILDNVRRRVVQIKPLGEKVREFTDRAGCKELEKRIQQLPDLRLHVFGHIHPGHGVLQLEEVTFVNAATCDSVYIPNQKPIVLDLEIRNGEPSITIPEPVLREA